MPPRLETKGEWLSPPICAWVLVASFLRRAVWTELQMSGSRSGQRHLPGFRKSQVQTNNYKPGGREGLAGCLLK